MSWTCPRHVLGMGTCPKIPGTESDDQPFFCRIWSVMCPLRVLRVSHVSNTLKKQRKTELKSTKSSKFDWMIYSIPLCNLSFSNYSFGITTPTLIPNWKKWGIKKKYASPTHKKCIMKQISSSFPLVPLLILVTGKNTLFSFFIFSFFDQYILS